MRTQILSILFLLFTLPGCLDSNELAANVRARLQTTTELILASDASAGQVTASHYTAGGWQAGSSAIAIASGELDIGADAAGDLEVEALVIDAQPITLPPSVFGTAVTLENVSLTLASPTLLPATWVDNDGANASAALPMRLQWAIDLAGVAIELGSPQLPPLPTTVTLSGTGEVVNARVTLDASGTLWSWADLLQLDGLQLSLSASSEPLASVDR
jgi:hypothetical protein